ncbi:MAG: GNAT family N-acetyltransferase [Patescibacteria group bacterium]
MKKIKLEGTLIYLRPVEISDATKEYVGWLNDPEVNQYLESRFSKHTSKNLREYINNVLKDSSYIFLAIIRKDSDKHIGNIKLGPINKHHKFAEIGIMIGDKDSWGHGYASEAIGLLSDFSFNRLKLHKIIAGAYENNTGSIKAFTKNGFTIEDVRKELFLFNGKYINSVMMVKSIL